LSRYKRKERSEVKGGRGEEGDERERLKGDRRQMERDIEERRKMRMRRVILLHSLLDYHFSFFIFFSFSLYIYIFSNIIFFNLVIINLFVMK
jgi:hypothetical protein